MNDFDDLDSDVDFTDAFKYGIEHNQEWTQYDDCESDSDSDI